MSEPEPEHRCEDCGSYFPDEVIVRDRKKQTQERLWLCNKCQRERLNVRGQRVVLDW